jgi:hypothetical protein
MQNFIKDLEKKAKKIILGPIIKPQANDEKSKFNFCAGAMPVHHARL